MMNEVLVLGDGAVQPFLVQDSAGGNPKKESLCKCCNGFFLEMNVKDVYRPLADVGHRSAVGEENPLCVAFDVAASSARCDVKPDAVARVTSRWHMHVTAAQPVLCRIQTCWATSPPASTPTSSHSV